LTGTAFAAAFVPSLNLPGSQQPRSTKPAEGGPCIPVEPGKLSLAGRSFPEIQTGRQAVNFR
jgi:hypothetical protein